MQQNARQYVPRLGMKREVQQIFELFPMHQIEPRLKPSWVRRLRNMTRAIPVWPIGWKVTSRKV